MTQVRPRRAGAFRAQGRPVPARLVGELRDASALIGRAGELAARLAAEGHLLLRGAVDAGVADAARRAVFRDLAGVDEVLDADGDARATGRSARLALHPDRGAFWKSVSEQRAMREVTHGPRLTGILSQILGEPARPFDFVFLRPGVNGRFTRIHCDKPFFTRATERVLTCWIALGPIPVERGPLFVVEGSHRWPDVKASVEGYDVARDSHRMNSVTTHPAELATERTTRLLTTDFSTGDVVVFDMYLLHGAFDNHEAGNRVRLSCDVRFQPAADAIDPRYFGPAAGGTTGGGYGELNGSKPLTEDWHQR